MAEAHVEDASNSGDSVICPCYRRPRAGDCIHQGELLRRVWEWDVDYDGDGKPVGGKAVSHRFAIVVTQDCDLTQDYKKRVSDWNTQTDLQSILLCPVWPGEELRQQREEITSTFWRIVRANKAERYHYLAKVPKQADALEEGHVPLLVDFRSHFTVRTVELYRQIRAAGEDSASAFTVMDTPWREHLQQRFANYIARIGLRVDHFTPESRR